MLPSPVPEAQKKRFRLLRLKPVTLKFLFCRLANCVFPGTEAIQQGFQSVHLKISIGIFLMMMFFAQVA